MEYAYKTKPFEHQAKELQAHVMDESRGLLLDMGLGKSKIIIDTASILFQTGEIDGLLIIAPNGVHTNWVSDEIPKHMPDHITEHTSTHVYHSKKAKTKAAQASLNATLEHTGLSVLVMSYDAMMTEKGCAAAKSFLLKKKCLYVLDESQRIKTPGAKRTKRILASAKYAPYRRILSGTPVPNTPFDAYTQICFLNPVAWRSLGIRNFSAFKSYFGIWQNIQMGDGRGFNKCISYKNLSKLTEVLNAHCLRLLTEDVLDLPDKVYTRRYFELTPKQYKMYRTMKEDFILWLESTEEVSAPLAIVRMLRLQQIACGYLPPDDDATDLRLIEDRNPRLACLKEICEDLPEKANDDTIHKSIIWARYTKDIDLICEMLGETCVRYDGQVSIEDRETNLKKFREDDEVKFFVAKTQVAGEGLTLTEAKTVIYYSNHFNLGQRLQSEKRAHRIGQDQTVTYIDIIAESTIDAKIVDALIEKFEVSSIVTGDRIREWI